MDLPGYRLTETLYVSAKSHIARAQRALDGQSVIVKRFIRPNPPEQAAHALTRWRREFDMHAAACVPGVSRALEFIEHGGRWSLIVEDIGGQSLDRLITDRPLPVAQALELAVRLCRIVDGLHQRGILHRDICPGNIVWNQSSAQVQLIDFGSATYESQNRVPFCHPELLAGTLLYMAPEQTGRKYRPVDYRADYYSFGATLYHLITGRPPFDDSDPLNLIHCHLTKAPRRADRIGRWVPPAVSTVLAALLAKSPDNRYQSTGALEHDLRQLNPLPSESTMHSRRPHNRASLPEAIADTMAEALLGERTTTRFEPRARDVRERFHIARQHYGRTRERFALIRALERAAGQDPEFVARSELVLIAGDPGIGKNSLARELYEPLTQWRGLFAEGRYRPLRPNLPYSAIMDAFRSLIAQLGGDRNAPYESHGDASGYKPTEPTRAHWATKLTEAVGANGRVLTEVIPELEDLIGPQPPVVALNARATRNRFHRVFHRLVCALATSEHPLVLFLDEMQWADSASMALIHHMLLRPYDSHLLIVGSYRSQKVGREHPLRSAMEQLQAHNVPIRELHPQPLTLEHLTRLLATTLDCDDKTVKPLAELLGRLTGGNPFFVHEVLATLHEQGLLEYKSDQRQWSWNVAEIVWRDFPDNVVTFALNAMQRLPEDTQRLLHMAACLGRSFDVGDAAYVGGHDLTGARALLQPAIAAGFVRPAAARASANEPTTLEFRHGVLQQAASQLFAEPSRRELHLAIGRKLLTRHRAAGDNRADDSGSERADPVELATLVRHFNIGARCITESAERMHLARLNLQLGQRAESDSSYAEADAYYESAEQLLGQDAPSQDRSLARDVHRARVRVAYLAGEYQRAIERADAAIVPPGDDIERAWMNLVHLAVERRQARGARCLEIAAEILQPLGVDWPTEQTLDRALGEQYAFVEDWLGEVTLEDWLARPLLTDERAQVMIQILAAATPRTSQRDSRWFAWLILRGLAVQLEHGPSERAPTLLSLYGLVLHTQYDQIERGLAAAHTAVAALAAGRYPDAGSHSYGILANDLLPWCEPIPRSLELNHRGYQYALDHGDIRGAGSIAMNDIWLRLYAGCKLQTTAERSALALTINQQADNEMELDHLRAQNLLIKRAIGDDVPGGDIRWVQSVEPTVLHRLQTEQRFSALAHYHVVSAFIAYVHGDIQAASSACERARMLAPYIADHVAVAYLDFHECLVRSARYPEATADERAEHWQALQTSQRRLTRWAERGPANFSHMRELIAAEIARLSGAVSRAAAGYQRAAQLARTHDFVHHEAVANELAARLPHSLRDSSRQSSGLHGEVRRNALDAHFCYRLWGNRRKVVDVRAEFSAHLTEATVNDLHTPDSGPHMAPAGAVASEVLASCLAMIAELEMAPIMELAMAAAIGATGVERGLIVVDGRVHLDSCPPDAGQTVGASEGRELSVAVDDYPWLATSALDQVECTGATVVATNAANDPVLASDPYIVRFGVRSLVCLPVMRHVKPRVSARTYRRTPRGCLYLEDTRDARQYSPAQLHALQLISQHLGIAIGNAQRHRQSNLEVTARTRELAAKRVELRTALDRLETAQNNLLSAEKLASLGRISAGIAHELKNPLNFVVNFSDLAAELSTELVTVSADQPDDALSTIQCDLDDLKIQTEQINKHAQRANSIIHGMMRQAGRASSHHEEVAINDLVDQHVKLAISAPAISEQAREITIERDYDPGAGSLVVSALEIGQVVLNLVNNAFYAVLHRRTLAHADEDYRPTVSLTTIRHADRVIIRVADNGTGIPEELQPRIFEPFYTTKPPGEGTGLGLSLSRDIIVQGHGGTLSVDSEPGARTDFVIELPV